MKINDRSSFTTAAAIALLFPTFGSGKKSPGLNCLARFERWCLGAVLLGAMPLARADSGGGPSLPHVDVITMTSMTESGRAYAVPTKANPVYYMIIDLGEQSFGRGWAGEQMPPKKTARNWMMRAMAQQGYLLADNQHPPTQVFVFSWGLLQGNPDRPAWKFFGLNNVAAFSNPASGNYHTGSAGIIFDLTTEDFFLGMVRSYDMASRDLPQKNLLWETRFGCPAKGLALDEIMPLLIKVASANLGRETPQPVYVDSSTLFADRFGPAVQRKIDYEALLADPTFPGKLAASEK